jgi:hypothetical protein
MKAEFWAVADRACKPTFWRWLMMADDGAQKPTFGLLLMEHESRLFALLPMEHEADFLGSC